MEFLKTQLARVQEQFAQLTASQKMLAAALVVITVMSLYHWTTFAGKSDTEALFNAPMGADQTNAAVSHLQGRGINAKVVGDRIYVSADQKQEAWGVLAFARLLPSDTRDAFEEMITKVNPLMPKSQTDMMYWHAREVMLSQILRFGPKVRHAMVMIDPRLQPGPGGAEPTGSVS